MYLELDAETGFIRFLGHWAVDDCGRIINPLLVEEQVRGGIVQGICSALYEECIHSGDGSMINPTLAEYLVPMAGEMPDIHVDHIESPQGSTQLGAKGVGEVGTIPVAAAIISAVEDALRPFGVTIRQTPIPPSTLFEMIDDARLLVPDMGGEVVVA